MLEVRAYTLTVFLRLCPREVPNLCFSFGKVFPSEACNNLAEPVEVDASEGDWIEAFPKGFPRLATSHKRAEVPVSTSPSRSRSGQLLGSQVIKCLE